MSFEELMVMAAAGGLAISTLILVRRRLLSIRYGLGWLTVAVVGFLGAPVLSVLAPEVQKLGFTPTGFSLGVVIVFLGLVCLQLSVSLSGLHAAIQDLAENAALVEERLRAVEAQPETNDEAETAQPGSSRLGSLA